MQHRAVWFFARWLRLPATPPDDAALGARALRAGRLDEAWEAFGRALTAAPDARARAAARNKRGLVLLARGERAGAQAEFEAALAEDGRCAAALTNLGNLQLEAGDLESAIGWFRSALAADDQHAEAHHNLGVAFRRQGKHAEAVRELRRATTLELRRKGH